MGYIPYIRPSDEHPPKKSKPTGWEKKLEDHIKQNEQADPNFYRDPNLPEAEPVPMAPPPPDPDLIGTGWAYNHRVGTNDVWFTPVEGKTYTVRQLEYILDAMKYGNEEAMERHEKRRAGIQFSSCRPLMRSASYWAWSRWVKAGPLARSLQRGCADALRP